MLRYILKFLAIYLTFVLAGAIQKPVFLIFHGGEGLSAADWFEVIYHGLSMDCTVAGYLTAVPGLLMVAGIWLPHRAWLQQIMRGYNAVAAVLMSLAAVANIGLYGHWGFPLDVTPVFYFTSSPSAAAASATMGEIIGAIVGFLIYTDLIFMSLYLIDKHITVDVWCQRPVATLVGLLLVGLLFIPIRGGFTVSTMNPGRAYYSQNNRLNHAAVNPFFSFLYSATHQADFGSQFRYLDPEVADETFKAMTANPTILTDTLFEGRPDIYLIIAESFSSHLLPSQGGEAIAVRLDSLARNGVLFDNFYASSFRTDRALPAILGAIPGQPNTSLMKYISKTEGLPSLPRSLKDAGYALSYYYGGDINFTNMKSYLVNCGFEDIVCDRDFPVKERTGKWGAHDHLLFDKVLADTKSSKDPAPQLRVIQTSSSHEPFEVPYTSHHRAPAANAFAYTDSCIGAFADSVSRLPRKSLIVIVPDHYGCYPVNLEGEPARHHVPLIFAGNALQHKGIRIHRHGSQTDLAATILGQLGIDATAFKFSRDMLADIPAPFAFYSSPNAIALSDSTATATVDISTVQSQLASAKLV
ncbi:MAG: sulfatase-like hydrolase/transferase [Muribaculaceae bacterium]